MMLAVLMIPGWISIGAEAPPSVHCDEYVKNQTLCRELTQAAQQCVRMRVSVLACDTGRTSYMPLAEQEVLRVREMLLYRLIPYDGPSCDFDPEWAELVCIELLDASGNILVDIHEFDLTSRAEMKRYLSRVDVLNMPTMALGIVPDEDFTFIRSVIQRACQSAK